MASLSTTFSTNNESNNVPVVTKDDMIRVSESSNKGETVTSPATVNVGITGNSSTVIATTASMAAANDVTNYTNTKNTGSDTSTSLPVSNDLSTTIAKSSTTNTATASQWTVSNSAASTTATVSGSHAGKTAVALQGENKAQLGGIRLAQFIQSMDDYTPTIPDEVTSNQLNRAGFDTSDPRVIRLVSLACQKFVSDIVSDSMQQCKMRSTTLGSKKGAKDKHYCLTMEDLTSALTEYGVHVKKPYYFSQN